MQIISEIRRYCADNFDNDAIAGSQRNDGGNINQLVVLLYPHNNYETNCKSNSAGFVNRVNNNTVRQTGQK